MSPLFAYAQWAPQYEAGIVHDSNFSRAQRAQDRVDDTALALRAAIDRVVPLGERADLTVGGEARIARFTRAHGASFAALGLSGTWRTKLGLGREAPWIAIDGSAALEDAREPVRDATRYAVSLASGRRFGERFGAAGGVAYDRRVQQEDLPSARGYGGKPFSLQGRALFARATYAVGAGASLFGSAAMRRGDVESSTRRNSAIFTAASAIAADPALGPDFIAYRLSGARTRTLGAGVSWELSRRSAIDATLTREDTSVGGGLDYDSTILGVTFVHRR